MKKTLITAIVAIIALFPVTACQNIDNTHSLDGRLSVVSTIFPYYDFVREIADGKVINTMLLKPGSESHSYEPTPRDIIMIQNCDLFIYTGGESDAWLDRILDSLDISQMNILRTMDFIDVLEESVIEGMEADSDGSGSSTGGINGHSGAAGTPEFDAHVWTSPRNAILITEAISGALCAIDQTNAAEYIQHADNYSAKLTELDAEFRAVVNSAAINIMVFADRFPFRYFAETYGLECYAAFPGCSAESEASAGTVAFLIDIIKSKNISVVYYTEFSNQQMADSISEYTGARKLLFHSCHNVSGADFDNGSSYLSLMQKNVETLKEGLL